MRPISGQFDLKWARNRKFCFFQKKIFPKKCLPGLYFKNPSGYELLANFSIFGEIFGSFRPFPGSEIDFWAILGPKNERFWPELAKERNSEALVVLLGKMRKFCVFELGALGGRARELRARNPNCEISKKCGFFGGDQKKSDPIDFRKSAKIAKIGENPKIRKPENRENPKNKGRQVPKISPQIQKFARNTLVEGFLK